MKITICASMKFAKEIIEVKNILERKGHKVLLPEMAQPFAEMALAYYLKKPIYILNPIPQNLPYTTEMEAMGPIILNGNLDLIKKD